MAGTSPAMTNECNKKTGPKRDRPFHSHQSRRLRSEILVRRRGCLVHGVLGGFLGIAHGLLALALHFLDHAFALKTVRASGFADALFRLAEGLVGCTLDLVCGRTHQNTPSRLIELRKDNP